MAIFIYSQSFCQKSAERKSPKKYFSYFVLISRTLALRLISQRILLDSGDLPTHSFPQNFVVNS